MCIDCCDITQSHTIQLSKPSPYILKRQKQILRLMNLVPKFPPAPAKKPVEKKKAKKSKR